MSADVTVRPARPADAAEAAPLIYAAGQTLYTLMFGPASADVLRLFERLFPRTRHPFSYDSGIVAEREGQIVGLALSTSAAGRRAGRPVRHRGMLQRTPHDADYLGILAAAPDCRRQGIAGLVLLSRPLP